MCMRVSVMAPHILLVLGTNDHVYGSHKHSHKNKKLPSQSLELGSKRMLFFQNYVACRVLVEIILKTKDSKP